jgi:IS605 OrfB family transposase
LLGNAGLYQIIADKEVFLATNSGRSFKVVKFKIDKALGQTSWREFTQLLRDVRHRVFRLANLVVSEKYLGLHPFFRSGKAGEFKTRKISELNKQLRQTLLKEKKADENFQNRINKTGVLPDTVAGALTQYRIRGLTTGEKWKQIIRGESSLPTFKLKMPIPVRCDKPSYRRLEKMSDGSIELDLMITLKPYPRVVLDTKKIDGSAKEILEHLLNEPNNYRQRYFEIKEDSLTKQWWLSVAYEYKPERPTHLKPDIVVGVDIGYSVPLYAALNNGLARLGKREFGTIGHRIKVLRNQVMARRRDIQRSGRVNISGAGARSGHGRKRKLLPTEILQKRIDDAQTTVNHQMSAAVIDFAIDHGAGKIQMEDVKGLGAEITGTFLSQNWRYYQLQQFIKYKADAKGIKVVPVNPRFTSRRCSRCGHINEKFDRAYRDKEAAKTGKTTRFICSECRYEEGPDYNAAKNIATIDIENKIKLQCKKQDLKYEEE